MKIQHMIALLVGHTLAEGRPIGPLLRDLGEPGAASRSESGSLEESLQYLNIEEPLRRMAMLCPGALQPTQKRLAALPSPLLLQLPLIQALGYLALVGLLQGLCLMVLQLKVLPNLEDLTESTSSIDIIQLAPLGLGALCVLLPVTIRLLSRQRSFGWSLHYERARQAAMAAGMAAAGATMETRREFSDQVPLIDHAGASAAELDLIFDRSLTLAEQAHQRLVSLVKLLGIGGLLGIAALVTLNIYTFIAAISVTI